MGWVDELLAVGKKKVDARDKLVEAAKKEKDAKKKKDMAAQIAAAQKELDVILSKFDAARKLDADNMKKTIASLGL